MENLFEQLQNNTLALKRLEVRYADTLTSEFYTIFNKESERIEELQWISQIQKRVYRMRYRILENISRKVVFEMNSVSLMTRDLSIKVA